MSLILDALKKAQKEQHSQTASNPLSTNPILQDRSPSSKRTLFLLILVIMSFCLLLYTRTIKKPSATSVPQPITFPSASNDPKELQQKGLEFFQTGKFSEAKAVWEKLTLLLPTDAEVYNNLGLSFKKMDKKEEALQAYTQALALKKDYPEALNNLGTLLLEKGAFPEAKKSFESAIALSKDYADPHFNLAILFEQQGNLKQAASEYEKFLSLSSNTDPQLKKKLEQKIGRLEKP